MRIVTLADLYLDMLQDMRSCETQIIKALPRMAKAADHSDLAAAFKIHLDETKEQLQRLEIILASLSNAPGRKVCEATVGLVKEGAELIETTSVGGIRDAGLICAARKIEHYEIASYSCLETLASRLGRDSDAHMMHKSLNEETSADTTLTALAMSALNADSVV